MDMFVILKDLNTLEQDLNTFKRYLNHELERNSKGYNNEEVISRLVEDYKTKISKDFEQLKEGI